MKVTDNAYLENGQEVIDAAAAAVLRESKTETRSHSSCGNDPNWPDEGG